MTATLYEAYTPVGPEKTLEIALRYAELGYPVLPLYEPRFDVPNGCACAPLGQPCEKDSAGKHPRIGEWNKAATTNPDIIRGWLRKWPTMNIGLTPRDGEVVVDKDAASHSEDPNAIPGAMALRLLEEQHGDDFPDCATQITPSGGEHAICGLPDGMNVSNHSTKMPALVDIRGSRTGYIVVEPSLYKNGGHYQWAPGQAPWDYPVAPQAPGWFVDLLKSSAKTKYIIDPELLPTHIPERLKRVLAAAGIRVEAKREEHGRITLMILDHCPACQDAHGTGRCFVLHTGRLFSLHENSCPAGRKQAGGKGLAVEEWVEKYAPHARQALTAKTEPGQLKRPDDDRLAIVLTELAEAGDPGAGAAWMAAAGFTGELDEELHGSGLTYAPGAVDRDAPGLSRAALAICNAAATDEVLLAVSGTDGKAVTGLWLRADGVARGLNHRGFPSMGDLDDGMGLLGSLPAAIATGIAGGAVYIADSPRDYLALECLRRRGHLKGEVIGIVKASGLRRLTTRLNRAWMEAGALPPKVVLVRTSVPEAEALAAMKRLDGRAGVQVFEPTPPPGGQGGLAWSIAHYEPFPTARTLNASPVIHPVPTNILKSEDAIRQGAEHVMRLAVEKDQGGKPRLVIFVVDAGAGKTTRAALHGAAAAVGEYPELPANGKRPKDWPDDAEWPPKLRRIGIALPSHKLTAEKEAQLRELVPGVDATTIKGAMSHCVFKGNVKEMFPALGRTGVCGPAKDSDQRCPEAAKGCKGAIEPSIEWGQVAFMAHQMVSNVKMDLCFIDESPGVLRDPDPVDRDMVATLFASRIMQSVKRWRTVTNPDAGEAAYTMKQVFQSLADKHAMEVSSGVREPYPRYLHTEELLATLKDQPGLLQALADGYGKGAKRPPRPYPNDVRAGSVQLNAFPSMRAFNMLRRLQRWVSVQTMGEYDRKDADALKVIGPGGQGAALEQDDDNDDAGGPAAQVVVHLGVDGAWSLHLIKRNPLPKCPTVIMDATGEVTIDEWKAAYPDRDVKVYRLRVQGVAPRQALHLKTRSLRRRHLFDENGSVTVKGAQRVRTAALHAARLTMRQAVAARRQRSSMGFLLYKPLYDLMTGETEPETHADYDIIRLKADIEALRIDLILGYYGKHDRGTNDFEQVDTLIFLGDPTPNIGAVEMQAQWMGLKVDKVAKDRAHATLIQSAFRARHTRRVEDTRVNLVYVGERAPELLGVEWDAMPLRESRRMAGSTKLAIAYAAAEFVAQEMGDVIGVRLIRTWEFHDDDLGKNCLADIDDRTLFEAVRRYAHAHDLVERGFAPWSPTGGRPPSYFGPSEEAIYTTLDEVFGDRAVDQCKNSEIIDDSGAVHPTSSSSGDDAEVVDFENSARKRLSSRVSTKSPSKHAGTHAHDARVRGDSEAAEPPDWPPDDDDFDRWTS